MDEVKHSHTETERHVDVVSVTSCLQHGDAKLALQYCHELLAHNPEHVQTLLFAALASRSLNWLDDALAFIHRALALAPHQPSIHSLMGDILLLQKCPEQALGALLRAKKLGDTSAQIYFNIGSAYLALDAYEDAKICFDQTLAIDPQMVAAYVNKGLVEHSLMNLDAALDCFDKALNINPGSIDAQWNKSHVSLTLGRYKEGFRLYEKRWKHPNVRLKHQKFDSRLWLGQENLSGKTILLFAEGGFGDTLQFVRYAKLSFDEDVKLIIQCQKPLAELIEGMGLPAVIITLSDIPPRHDYHCSLMSLPLAFGTTISSIPKFDQYIFASQQYLLKWKGLFASSVNTRIGVVARGSTGHQNDKNRSMDLETLLQFLPKEQNISYCKEKFLKRKFLHTCHKQYCSTGKRLESFSDTAAICEQLDLIVSVDTSVAHLASAMGKPTIILLPYRPDWRWGASGRETAWYPTATLLRQEHQRSWASAFNCCSNNLSEPLT